MRMGEHLLKSVRVFDQRATSTITVRLQFNPRLYPSIAFLSHLSGTYTLCCWERRGGGDELESGD